MALTELTKARRLLNDDTPRMAGMAMLFNCAFESGVLDAKDWQFNPNATTAEEMYTPIDASKTIEDLEHKEHQSKGTACLERYVKALNKLAQAQGN